MTTIPHITQIRIDGYCIFEILHQINYFKSQLSEAATIWLSIASICQYLISATSFAQELYKEGNASPGQLLKMCT